MKKILIIIIAVLAVVIIFKDALIKTAITTIGSNVVGAPIKIGKFSSSVIAQKVTIKDFKLYNPKGFPKEAFVDIPEITIKIDTPSIIKGFYHVPLFVLDIKEVVIIKDKDGNLNVDALNAAKETEKKEEAKSAEKPKAFKMKIDLLRFNITRIVSKDYSQGKDSNPKIEVFDVNLKDKTFKDIISPEQFVSIIMVESMKPTAFKGAKIYGAATLLGVGFLPAGVAGVLISKDDATAEFKLDFKKVYDASLAVATEMGKVSSADSENGIIKAKVESCSVTIRLDKIPENKVRAIVSARQLILPKPQIAGGVLRQIEEKLGQ